MAFQPVHAPQPLLLAPPLLPPLVLRTENGFLGAKRPGVGAFGNRPPAPDGSSRSRAAPTGPRRRGQPDRPGSGGPAPPHSIPMYEPTTEHERGLATVLTKALELGRPVEVEYRDSVFFGPHRVPASVRLA